MEGIKSLGMKLFGHNPTEMKLTLGVCSSPCFVSTALLSPGGMSGVSHQLLMKNLAKNIQPTFHVTTSFL